MSLATLQVLSLDVSRSTTVFRLPDGRSERLEFQQIGAAEFTVKDPAVDAEGHVTLELEVLKTELRAVSRVLWPGQTIRVTGGTGHGGQAIHASVRIPAGTDMSEGVEGDSYLFWQMETPIGVLHNAVPIHMKGRVVGLPPVGSTFRSSAETPLLNAEGEVIATIYDCLQMS